jgi:hypothetical protein
MQPRDRINPGCFLDLRWEPGPGFLVRGHVPEIGIIGRVSLERLGMSKGIGLLALLGLALVFPNVPARADFIVYTNRSMFEAALASEKTETFSELGQSVQSFPNGLSQPTLTQPITVNGTGGFLLSAGSSVLGTVNPSYGTILIGPTSNSATDGITVSLPSNAYTGAGADVTGNNANTTISFFGTTSLGENFTGTVSVQGANFTAQFGFLGVTTTSPTDYLTSLTFSAPVATNFSPIVTNVSIGAAIPEPTSMALFVAGALVIGVGAIRQRFASRSV